MIPTTDRKQNPLASLVVDYGISGAAKKLGYSYAYIHQVINGKMDITENMKKRIASLSPPAYAPRTTTYWPDTPEGRAGKAKAGKLSMAQRRDALLSYKGE